MNSETRFNMLNEKFLFYQILDNWYAIWFNWVANIAFCYNCGTFLLNGKIHWRKVQRFGASSVALEKPIAQVPGNNVVPYTLEILIIVSYIAIEGKITT